MTQSSNFSLAYAPESQNQGLEETLVLCVHGCIDTRVRCAAGTHGKVHREKSRPSRKEPLTPGHPDRFPGHPDRFPGQHRMSGQIPRTAHSVK